MSTATPMGILPGTVDRLTAPTVSSVDFQGVEGLTDSRLQRPSLPRRYCSFAHFVCGSTAPGDYE